MEKIGVKITGVGMAVPGYSGVPGKIVTNETLAKALYERGEKAADRKSLREEKREEFLVNFRTSDEWIRTRTGIETRSIADKSIATSDLAKIAVEEALQCSGLSVATVEQLNVATVTPDHLSSPPTIAILAQKLGLNGIGKERLGTLFGSDETVACSSFLEALVKTYAAIASGVCKNGIVVGADIMSRTVNRNDREFFPLVGDGAGALVLEACPASESALHPHWFYAGRDGRFAKRIIIEAGGSRLPLSPKLVSAHRHHLTMDGKAVFKEMVSLLFSEENPQKSIIGMALERAQMSLDAIALLCFHQANLRIIGPVEKKLRTTAWGGKKFSGRIFNNMQRYGNTSSASIPILLAEAHGNGMLKYGDTFMAIVFGGGYSWNTAIGKWTVNSFE